MAYIARVWLSVEKRFSQYRPVRDVSGELRHKSVPSHCVVVLLMWFSNCEVVKLHAIFTSHCVPAYCNTMFHYICFRLIYDKDENNLLWL